MHLTKPTQEEVTQSLYTVSLHCRVPCNFKRKLTEEAAIRSMTLSEYSGTLLISAHQDSKQQLDDLEQLKKEYSLLMQRLDKLAHEFCWLTEADKETLKKLKKNKEALMQLYAGPQPVSKKQLEDAGFDFHFATAASKAGGKVYYHVFDMCYTLKGETIIIEKA